MDFPQEINHFFKSLFLLQQQKQGITIKKEWTFGHGLKSLRLSFKSFFAREGLGGKIPL